VTEYLDLDDLLAAAEAAVGGRADVRDVGLLQAAAARPQASGFGEEAYPALDAKAAALLQSIVAGHPLVDGNKRLGWVAVRLFYLMNGTDIRPHAIEAFDMITAIAAGGLDDVSAIAAMLHAEDPLDLGDEVGVAGRVDEIDREVANEERGNRGANRDAALAFELERGGLGGAGVDAPDVPDRAGGEKETLGEGGLTGVDVGEDSEIERAHGTSCLPRR